MRSASVCVLCAGLLLASMGLGGCSGDDEPAGATAGGSESDPAAAAQQGGGTLGTAGSPGSQTGAPGETDPASPPGEPLPVAPGEEHPGGQSGGEQPVDGPDSIVHDAGTPMPEDGECDCGSLACCNGKCVNLGNDPLNCGECGTVCGDDAALCNGSCSAPPEGICGGCADGQLCCAVEAGTSRIGCFDAVDGTCPVGCPACDCAAPDTPILTPDGERPIASIREGDLVYSTQHGRRVVVPVLRASRRPQHDHMVVRVLLGNGRELSISGGHPTADGRDFDDLLLGGALDGVPIREAEVVPYEHAFTYDILPDSESGTYYAAGVLIGSTLQR